MPRCSTKLLLRLLAIVSLCSSGNAVAESPSPQEVLKRYSAARDQCTSYSVKIECTLSQVREEQSPFPRVESAMHYVRDGMRQDLIEELPNFEWPPAGLDVNELARVHQIYDAGVHISIFERQSQSEYWVSPMEEEAKRELHLAPTMDFTTLEGFLASDPIPVTTLLQQASELGTQEDDTTIAGKHCVLISATVPHYGKYRIWFAPEMQWNILKAEAVKKDGNVFSAATLDKSSLDSVVWEVGPITYSLVSGTYFPEDFTTVEKQTGSGRTNIAKRHFRFSEVDLSPDLVSGRCFSEAIPEHTFFSEFYTSNKLVWNGEKLAPLELREGVRNQRNGTANKDEL